MRLLFFFFLFILFVEGNKQRSLPKRARPEFVPDKKTIETHPTNPKRTSRLLKNKSPSSQKNTRLECRRSNRLERSRPRAGNRWCLVSRLILLVVRNTLNQEQINKKTRKESWWWHVWHLVCWQCGINKTSNIIWVSVWWELFVVCYCFAPCL